MNYSDLLMNGPSAGFLWLQAALMIVSMFASISSSAIDNCNSANSKRMNKMSHSAHNAIGQTPDGIYDVRLNGQLHSTPESLDYFLQLISQSA